IVVAVFGWQSSRCSQESNHKSAPLHGCEGKMPSRQPAGCRRYGIRSNRFGLMALREFCFGGKNGFSDQMGIRHGYPVAAFPLRVVQCGVCGLKQFLLGSTMLRKLCDAYRNGDRSERLALVR